MASSREIGCALHISIVPFTGVSKTMTNPAASLRYCSTTSSGAPRKLKRSPDEAGPSDDAAAGAGAATTTAGASSAA
jgi:hypothetical protein